MALTPEKSEHFSQLHTELLRFAEKELQPVLPPVSRTEEDDHHVTERLFAIRDAVHEYPQVIDRFVQQNPASLPAEDLAAIAKWKAGRVGGFHVLHHCADHSIFMGADDDHTPRKDVYAVSPLREPFTKVVGESLPTFVRTALLPFQQQIVFDGVLQAWRVDLGDDVRRHLSQLCEYVTKTSGIVTTLSPDVTRKSVRYM
jgi:hypothetical protein